MSRLFGCLTTGQSREFSEEITAWKQENEALKQENEALTAPKPPPRTLKKPINSNNKKEKQAQLEEYYHQVKEPDNSSLQRKPLEMNNTTACSILSGPGSRSRSSSPALV